jgi:peptidoglycan/LPS O-acetylase OafA/YrhL
LDGLRGFAALSVVVGHIYGAFFGNYSNVALPNSSFFAYKPLFLLYDAALAVEIFFVLSGFVLSYQYMQFKNESYLQKLVIKRIPRLGIPVFFVLLLSGILNAGEGAHNEMEKLALIPKLFVYNVPGFLELFQFSFFKVFIPSSTQLYIGALWTLRYEFWGSMLIALMAPLLCRMRFNSLVYFLVLIVTLVYSYHFGSFLFGLGLCYIYVNYNRYFVNRHLQYTAAAGVMVFFVLYITLFRTDILISFYACFVVVAVLFVPALQAFFSTKPLLFLGKISFPLYLVHMVVIASPISSLVLRHIKYFDSGWFQLSICTLAVIGSILAARAFYVFELMGIKSGAALANFLIKDKEK